MSGWVHVALVFGALLSLPSSSEALTAASCSSVDVQNAVNASPAGGTVTVPAGNCTWTTLSIAKPIVLQGAGVGLTNITVSGTHTVTLTKQAGGVIRMKGFSFSATGGGKHPFFITGPWKTAQPVVIENNTFTMSGSAMFDIFVAGGVVFSSNVFTGGVNDFSFTVKDLTNLNSWSTAGTMGTADVDGTMNIYIENNSFIGQSNGTIDCDDNCRVVMRHNTFTHGGFNSHGWDTSPYGMRHFEIYNNTFAYNDKTSPLSNVPQTMWIRGGTGVIFGNNIADLISQNWGNKPEIRLSLRGAEDARPQGACSATKYPVPHGLGRGHNGSQEVTEPIYIWNNVGAVVPTAGWAWGNPCGFVWGDFFQWGRDAIQNTPKPGYTPYVYPHPLAGGAEKAPSNVRIQ